VVIYGCVSPKYGGFSGNYSKTTEEVVADYLDHTKLPVDAYFSKKWETLPFSTVSVSHFLLREKEIIKFFQENQAKDYFLGPHMIDDFMLVNHYLNIPIIFKELDSQTTSLNFYESDKDFSRYFRNSGLSNYVYLFTLPSFSEDGNYVFFLTCEFSPSSDNVSSYAVSMRYDHDTDSWDLGHKKEFARFFYHGK
jgi:hypothetical protein